MYKHLSDIIECASAIKYSDVDVTEFSDDYAVRLGEAAGLLFRLYNEVLDYPQTKAMEAE